MDDGTPAARPPSRVCPICGKPTQERHRPFCSARCATIDLGRWLDGRYRIAADPAEPEDEAAQDEDES